MWCRYFSPFCCYSLFISYYKSTQISKLSDVMCLFRTVRTLRVSSKVSRLKVGKVFFVCGITAYENTSLLPTRVGRKLPIKMCSTLFLSFGETMILVDGRYFRNCPKLSSISSDNARILLIYCRTFFRTFLCGERWCLADGSCGFNSFFVFFLFMALIFDQS